MFLARKCAVNEFHQLSYLYTQHQCMNWNPPPTEIGFEYDPVKAAALLLDHGRYRPPTRPFFDEDCPTPWRPPANRFFGPADAMMPKQFIAGGWNTELYSHSRRVRADSPEMLVIVNLGCSAFNAGGTHAYINGLVFVPAGFRPGSVATPARRVNTLRFPLALNQPFHLFVGQSDPHDASHFTIRYEMSGGEGVIDGYLKLQSIEFSVRGPLESLAD